MSRRRLRGWRSKSLAAAPQSPFDQAAVVSTADSAVVAQLKQSQLVQALQRQAEALLSARLLSRRIFGACCFEEPETGRWSRRSATENFIVALGWPAHRTGVVITNDYCPEPTFREWRAGSSRTSTQGPSVPVLSEPRVLAFLSASAKADVDRSPENPPRHQLKHLSGDDVGH